MPIKKFEPFILTKLKPSPLKWNPIILYPKAIATKACANSWGMGETKKTIKP